MYTEIYTSHEGQYNRHLNMFMKLPFFNKMLGWTNKNCNGKIV